MDHKGWIVLILISVVLISSIAAAQGNPVGDILRPLADIAEDADIATKYLVFLFSLAMFSVAAFAYNRKRSRQLLIVAAAFGLFAVKWTLKIIDLYVSPGMFFGDASENVTELIVLLLLFYAIIRK